MQYYRIKSYSMCYTIHCTILYYTIPRSVVVEYVPLLVPDAPVGGQVALELLRDSTCVACIT